MNHHATWVNLNSEKKIHHQKRITESQKQPLRLCYIKHKVL